MCCVHLGTTDDDSMTDTSPDGGSNAGLVAWLGISLVIIILLIGLSVTLSIIAYWRQKLIISATATATTAEVELK